MLLQFFFVSDVFGQVQNINGMIVNDNARLSGAIIYNLKTGRQTASNMQGLFYIKGKSGDTLVTKLFNYKTDTLIICSQENVIIRLTPTAKILKEVIIKDSLLSPLKAYDKNKVEYKDIYWKGDKSHMIGVGVGMSIGISVNIDKLYSALSKQGKDSRRLQRTLASDYKNSVVDQQFSKSLVSRVTGYTGDKLNDFIVKYRPTYEFASKANNYDMIQYIKTKLTLDSKAGSD